MTRNFLHCCATLAIHGVVSSCFLALNTMAFVYGHIAKYFGSKVNIDPKREVVVITGCDTGFGELTSRKLQQMGFHVVAVCVTPEGVQRLTDAVSLPLLADVTKDVDIENISVKVGDYLLKHNVKLWGVVCNAGIGNSGAFDWISPETFRRVIEVNFFGVVNVTKALLPYLKKNKNSRIVNLSSVAGFLSAPMMSAYDASKHAVEGYAKALRAETKAWNIHVSNVNPGFMRTPIVQNGPSMNSREWSKVPKELRDQYGELNPPPDAVFNILEDPQLVVDDIINALTDSSPPMWYFPSLQAQYFFRHFTNCPSALLDGLFYLTRVSNPIEPQPKLEVLHAMQS